MSFATSPGCETIARWLDGTSTTVAPIRCGEQSLGVGWKGLIVNGNHVPRGQRLPGRDTHDVIECCGGQRLLNGVKDSRLHRINVGGEMVDKVVL